MPEPDSPTIAIVSPPCRSKLAFLTAGYQVPVDPEVDVEVADGDDGVGGRGRAVVGGGGHSGLRSRLADPAGRRWHDGEMTEVFRPWYGRLLTVVIALISASMVVFAAVQGDWADAALVLPWAGLVAGACWATFWRPRVEVSDAGVRIVNVTRTIHHPVARPPRRSRRSGR